jgi:hypothetical protein
MDLRRDDDDSWRNHVRGDGGGREEVSFFEEFELEVMTRGIGFP